MQFPAALRSGPAPLALAALLLSLAPACSSISVDTDYDPAADFSKLQSYAWMPVVPTGDPRIDSDLLDGRVRRSVEAELELRGYEKRGEAEVDFLVTYHAAIESKLDVNTVVSSYPYGYRGHPRAVYTDTIVNEYDLGTLIIDIVSARSKSLIWRGSGQARVNTSAGTPEERETRIRKAVAAIMKKFPPQ